MRATICAPTRHGTILIEKVYDPHIRCRLFWSANLYLADGFLRHSATVDIFRHFAAMPDVGNSYDVDRCGKSATLSPQLTPGGNIHSSPAKSPAKSPPSAYFRVVWQSPAACKLLKVHLIGAMAWKRSSVRSRPGPPIKSTIYSSYPSRICVNLCQIRAGRNRIA